MELKVAAKLDPKFAPLSVICRDMREATTSGGQDIIIGSDYYGKKQAEGKHHYVILGHIQKKLTRVIFSVLKNNSAFQERLV